jgi:hypothetical protein
MKVKITKAIKLNGDHFFYVYANDKYITCTYFMPGLEKESSSSEENAFAKIKEIAARLESSNGQEIEETVYQTPD